MCAILSEWVSVRNLRKLLRVTIQESDHLGAGAAIVRAECSLACTLGETLIYRPQNRVCIVSIGGNIRKEVRRGTVSLEGCLDSDLGCRHRERVLPVLICIPAL